MQWTFSIWDEGTWQFGVAAFDIGFLFCWQHHHSQSIWVAKQINLPPNSASLVGCSEPSSCNLFTRWNSLQFPWLQTLFPNRRWCPVSENCSGLVALKKLQLWLISPWKTSRLFAASKMCLRVMQIVKTTMTITIVNNLHNHSSIMKTLPTLQLILTWKRLIFRS